jgi:hypothetical protein
MAWLILASARNKEDQQSTKEKVSEAYRYYDAVSPQMIYRPASAPNLDIYPVVVALVSPSHPVLLPAVSANLKRTSQSDSAAG